MHPFLLKNGVQCNKKSFYESKSYHLNDLRKCYSQFGKMKLNDLMMACISASFSKCFTELGIPEDRQTHFSLSLPINMKPQAKSIEEIQFCNSCSL